MRLADREVMRFSHEHTGTEHVLLNCCARREALPPRC